MKNYLEELAAIVALWLFIATILVWSAILIHHERTHNSFRQRWEPLLQMKREK